MSVRAASALIFIGIALLIIASPAIARTQTGMSGDLLYVCNEGSGNISIIDLKTNAVVGSIERPSIPYGTALSPDGARLYVAGEYSNSISIIDTASGSLIDTVKIDLGPSFSPYIIASPDGQSLCTIGDYGLGVKVVNTTNFNVTAKSITGVRPRSAAFSPDGHMLYVADTGGNCIRAIDTGTGSVKGSIAFLGYPIGVSVSPDGKHIYCALISRSSYDRLYPTDCPTCTCLYPGFIVQTIIGLVTGKGTLATNDIDAVYEINARDLSVEAVIPLGEAPRAYAAGPGDVVYVACNGPYSNYLYAVDVKAKNVTDKILLGPGLNRSYWSLPGLMSASPDGSRVYLAESMDNRLLTVNMADHNITEIYLGARPASISAGLSKAYVSIEWENKVLVIDPDNNTIACTLNYWWDPKNIALSPDGSRAYVTSEVGNFITAIDTKENRIITDIPIGRRPVAFTVSPDGSRLYVTCRNETNYRIGNVRVIDARNRSLVKSIEVGKEPEGIWISPDGSRLYVVHFLDNKLTVIDTGTDTVVAAIGLKYSLMKYMAMSPDGSRFYLSTGGFVSSDIEVIDASNNTACGTIKAGFSPAGMAVKKIP